MRDIAKYGTWRSLLLIDAATVLLLVLAGALRSRPLLSDTAIVALPIAFAVTAAAFYVIKRKWGDAGWRAHNCRFSSRAGLVSRS